MRRRLLGGVWMACLSPGSWLSESGTIAVVHMMAGSRLSEWELYLTQLAKGEVTRVPDDPDDTDFLCCDHMCSALTFGELASDVAMFSNWAHNLSRNISKVCETQDQYHRWGFGPPDPRLGFHDDGKARSPMLPRSS